ncbi:nuclear pore complex protein NUP35 [Citrus sinensis]|uniref:Nuclear pore complex protein NUP35 n=1 Tax=Citrus sinensis TaxID=2711 RepID=A0ACB8J9P6_CITSI|nr:nuclear pore complex protein NUP35 [Citrus sinensis]
MSATVHRTPKSGRQSLFFQDLASPVSSRRKFSNPGQEAAVSALWRESFGGSDLPPPPMYTLEDRSDFSPESGISDYPVSPGMKSDLRTPIQSSGRDFSSTPAKGKSEASTSSAVLGGQQNQQVSAGFSWWSPNKASNSDQEEKGRGSPVEGVVQPGALITLPPPREVARPEIQRNTLPAGNLNEEEWVTVYGFPPADTNLVLREFEKCGVILKHVPGPRDANWMHILYQNRSDAQKALSKNGMQINGVLIVGVKPLDPMQRQALNERINSQGFMTLPPPSSRTSELNSFRASSRPYYLQNGNTSTGQSGGAVMLTMENNYTSLSSQVRTVAAVTHSVLYTSASKNVAKSEVGIVDGENDSKISAMTEGAEHSSRCLLSAAALWGSESCPGGPLY